MALADLEGRYVQVNDAYCRTVQRSREELIGQTPLVITHPDDVADSEYAMQRLIAGESEEYSFEKRYAGPDGEAIWAELTVGVFRDDAGSPQFLIGMIQGIGDRRLAQTLQRSMLTTQLPEVDGIEVAVRYLPGSRETEVGGDWYDLIPLPDGRVGVVIGDVVGRGIEAAGTMSQLRTALRAYAIEGLEPAEVVRKLHRLADHLGEGLSTTLVYLDLDPATREMRYVSAGHVPALHVDAPRRGALPRGRALDAARHAAGGTARSRRRGSCSRRGTRSCCTRTGSSSAATTASSAGSRSCATRSPARRPTSRRAWSTSRRRSRGDALRHDDIALLALRVDPAAT